jgi:hypothetical protein
MHALCINMGWLKGLMQRSRAAGSFDALAKACLQHPAWPADVPIRARSLGAILGKLDRNQELDWLKGRPEVQAILAETLGVPWDELQLGLPSPEPEGTRLAWRDLPRANHFDLLTEPLPPGLPERIQQFGRPPQRAAEQLWWQAPRGSGAGLAGRWLAARQQALTITPTLLDAQLRDPRKPIYLDLTGCEHTLSVTQAVAERLLASSRTSWLVASPFSLSSLLASSSAQPTLTSSYEVLTTPACQDFQEELLTWLLARLPTDSCLSQPRVRQFLRSWCEQHHAASFGELLGLSGVLDELGLTGPVSIDAVVDAFVLARAQRLFKHPAASWWEHNARTAIQGLVERCLLQGGVPWDAPRSQEAWRRLVPEDQQAAVDLGWLKLALPRAGAHIRTADIERAARELSPGAYQVVLQLQQMGILSATLEGELELGPRWLIQALVGRSLENWVEWGSAELGVAVLACSAPLELGGLLTAMLSGRLGLPETSELDAKLPSSVATHEFLLRLAGLAIIAGAPLDVSRAIELWVDWERAMRPQGPPLPIISFPASMVEAEPLLSEAAFTWACLALEQRADGHRMIGPSVGTDKQPKVEGLTLLRVLALLESSLRRSGPRALWLGSQLELSRSFDPDKELPEGTASLLGPLRLARACEQGRLSWQDVSRLTPDETTLELLGQLLEGSLSLTALMDELWRAFAQAGLPERLELLDPAWPWAALAWSRAPTPTVLELLNADRCVPYEQLSQSFWLELFRTAPERLPKLALRACPQQLRGALGAVAHELSPEVLEQLWLLEPTLCLEAAQSLAGKPEHALDLALAAPAAQLCTALELAGLSPTSMLRLPTQALARLLERLRALLAEREPGYAQCLELLLDLLDRTRPLRSLNTPR